MLSVPIDYLRGLAAIARDQFEKEIIHAFPYPPNQGQTEVIRDICRFLIESREKEVFLLKGYAGTGKTVLISALIKSLASVKVTCVLLAPTGRAAKVLSNFSGQQAQTIHKKIYRKELQSDGSMHFSLAENKHENCLFIVDEASMISTGQDDRVFGDLLENLFDYVFSKLSCRLIFIGDTAQLPPVNIEESYALNHDYLERYYHLKVWEHELHEVFRQATESQILQNATSIREIKDSMRFELPRLQYGKDVVRLSGEELEDSLNDSIRKYGKDEVIIITRSNKLARAYNQNMRNRIYGFEDALCASDRLMVIKNNYFWLDEKDEIGFIANGEQIEIVKIERHEILYGYDFYDCQIRLSDYPEHPVMKVKLNAALLHSDEATLSSKAQNDFFNLVMKDLEPEAGKYQRMNYLKKNPYFNALQVKFSYAITCHKAQGGQWSAVYLDPGFVGPDQFNTNYLRWLYTAITRAKTRLFLLNFKSEYFD